MESVDKSKRSQTAMSSSSSEQQRHNTLSLITQRCLQGAVISTSDVTETGNGERGTGNREQVLNFQKSQGGTKPKLRMFLNFAKICALSKDDNIKKNQPASF